MTLLSRLYGVRPALRHRVQVRRNVETPAADGVRLLATPYDPAGRRRPPLVLLRSPYGRANAVDQLPKLLAERGYQVLYQSLRGTAGSRGRFDGFVIDPADANGTLSWLRARPWFGGELATWGAGYLGFVQWELAARDIPEWKVALIQDAPSAFDEGFMYPGGAFATGNALGRVHLVERMLLGGHGVARQMAGMVGAARRLSRATLTLPLEEADRALTGYPVPWFRDWTRHGPGEPYWANTDHRVNVARMPPVVHLQGGWHDFFLPGMLDVALLGRRAPSGVRLFVTGAGRWNDVSAWPPAHEPVPWFLRPGGGLGPPRMRARAPPAATAPLAEDVEAVGPVRVMLHARSDNPHALWPMAHRFLRGRRVRVQVSSGAHPRFGRNPGTGEPLATGTNLRSSEHEIFHDHNNPSALWLPLTSGAS
ncbi:CocE/NonD family hydrolase [Nonomuraea bangladeshensis]|uniref:CocE/NonD family hydrolase n=1 Tax=Nonomuraea bangladeshensis TaxID=404385 RepID=UPI003C309129